MAEKEGMIPASEKPEADAEAEVDRTETQYSDEELVTTVITTTDITPVALDGEEGDTAWLQEVWTLGLVYQRE